MSKIINHKQAINVADLPDYVNDSGEMVQALIQGTQIWDKVGATVYEGIKGSERIFFMQTETGLQAFSCAFSATGDVIFTYKDVEVGDFKVNQTICPDDLSKKFSQAWLQKGAPTQLPENIKQWWVEGVMAKEQAKLEQIAFHGDTTGSGVDAVVDGWVTQIEDDATSKFGVSITGSISTTTLTVSAVSIGMDAENGTVIYLKPGMKIEGVNVTGPCYIVSQLSGTTGGIGTYKVSYSQTAASATIRATTIIDPNPVFVGSQTTTTLTVSEVILGTIRVGQTVVTGGNVAVTSQTILAQLTGETGGVGTYTVSASQTVAALTTMTSKFASLNKANIQGFLADVYSALPDVHTADGMVPTFKIMLNYQMEKILLASISELASNNNYFNSYGLIKEGENYSYNGVDLIFTSGLNRNEALATFAENLWIITDMLSDIKAVKTIDLSDTTGDLQIRLVVPKFSLGFGYGKGQYIVYSN
jgi:hypothetical protein